MKGWFIQADLNPSLARTYPLQGWELCTGQQLWCKPPEFSLLKFSPRPLTSECLTAPSAWNFKSFCSTQFLSKGQSHPVPGTGNISPPPTDLHYTPKQLFGPPHLYTLASAAASSSCALLILVRHRCSSSFYPPKALRSFFSIPNATS